MRLLHFDQAGRLLLADFSDKATPPYAILSHRWGDSEVLFVDIINRSYEEKDGYRKIVFCAEQAAKDQLQYFWIDTCCIDKWNLNELSRSINSMFDWYKDAKRCYVFLPDVLVATTTATDQQIAWESSFRASEWFRRGWTLQELIAPNSVEFFSLGGQRIGDKRSLGQLVHEITDIPTEALQGCSLDKFTIAERIEWTKNRETTEEEDIIYCLLGILDISMPASYGEGRKKARIRLEAEMNSNAPFLVPFSQNDNFVGRELQLAELEVKLFKSKQPVIAAITGPGGTGKTQLALEFAHRTRQQNKSCSIFWIDASSIDGVQQSYADIARKLKLPGWNDDKIDVKRVVKLHLSGRNAGQSLLIYDNADSASLMSAESSRRLDSTFMDYLPRSELCSILFTTIDGGAGRILACQNTIELQELEQDMAQNMLERYLDTPVLKADKPESELLLQELSYLPLAIAQAAAYINTKDIKLQAYRTQLVKKQQKYLERNNVKPEDRLQEYDMHSPVAITLHLSIEQICRDSPLAAEYLFLAACVDRKDILLEFLEAPSHHDREDAIGIINSYKLVTRRPAESALDLHRLVHVALRGWLWKQNILEKWTETAIRRLSRAFPNDSHGNRSMWRRMLPHAKYALAGALNSRNDAEKTDLMWKCAKALMTDGRYSESEVLFTQAATVREGALGTEHPDTLTSISNLGSVLKSQGKYEEAEAMHRQALQVREKVLGVEHPSTLNSVGNLGLVLESQGKYEEAEAMHRRALQVREKVLGVEHSSTLASISNLGSVLKSQGKYEEAEAMHRQALQGYEKMLGAEHPYTLTSVGNLGLVLESQGKYEEAEAMHRRALQVREKVLGVEHPSTLTSVGNLGLVLESQGKYEEAEAMHRRALQVREKVLGVEHPSTLTSVSNLGLVLDSQGKYEEAEMMHRRDLQGSEKVLGVEHPDTLTSISNLGSVLKSQGKYEEAEAMNRRALQGYEKMLGVEHPYTLTSVGNLGLVLESQGKYEEAEAMHRRALQVREKVLGVEHSDTLTSVSILGSMLKSQGRYEEAEAMHRRALQVREKVLGVEHPDTLTSVSTLGISILTSKPVE